MGRRPRLHFDGANYHVFARGVDKRPIYADDVDRSNFLTILRSVKDQAGAEVTSWCLMTNHFHMSLRVGSVSTSAIMQRLLGRYSRLFNRKYGRAGHLFDARYHALLCMDDSYLSCLIRYIHMNPVKAGLVKDPAEWRWSSARAYRDRSADSLVTVLSELPGLDAELPDGFEPVPPEAYEPTLLRAEPRTAARPLEELLEEAHHATGVPLEEIKHGKRRTSAAPGRKQFIIQAAAAGHPHGRIAEFLGISRSAVSRYAAVQLNSPPAQPDTDVTTR